MNTTEFASQIRLLSLKLCHRKKTSHIGGALSIADILAVLYNDIFNINHIKQGDKSRDRLFYSKGHACSALYSALALKGLISESTLLEDFTENGCYFTSHVNHKIPGIELSTGSLGHALSVACGSAIAEKRSKHHYSVFTILSDGELNEGSNWEAILFAGHHKLDNLITIIDYNKIQSFGRVEDVLELEPLADKFKAFNWSVTCVDGHNVDSLKSLFLKEKNSRNKKPKCVIANTVKGKGVSFMENTLKWHYKSPDQSEFDAACTELRVV